MTPLATLLADAVAASGPLPVAQWMALCLGHPRHGYYVTRDPLGRDFTTAPEISQMFGELIGLWCADLWQCAGSPPRLHLVELGPGRGTLMADLRRATARVPGFAAATAVHFVETSPVLRARQATRVPHATWHDALDTVPADAPLIVIANEFFDALPVRQFVATPAGWFERCVGWRDGRFVDTLGAARVDALIPPALADAAPGTVVESSPASTATAAEIGARLRAQGGAALIIDYGHAAVPTGDTLQALRGGAAADPFAAPGEADLTAHVDFGALAAAAGATAHGPVAQGAWLARLGIDARLAVLTTRTDAAASAALAAGVARLTETQAMGTLFKVLALTAPGWPVPEGFA